MIELALGFECTTKFKIASYTCNVELCDQTIFSWIRSNKDKQLNTYIKYC